MTEETEGELDQAGFNTWIPMRNAVEFLSETLDEHDAREEIYRRLSIGRLLAAAEYAVTDTTPPKTFEYWILNHAFWRDEREPEHYKIIWQTGAHKFEWRTRNQYSSSSVKRTLDCIGIRIEPEELRAILVSIGADSSAAKIGRPAALPSPIPAKPKGGRPRLEYWEPLLIEMARQLYAGELTPTRLVDIETAMQDWLTQQGYEWTETPVRDRARRLLESLQD